MRAAARADLQSFMQDRAEAALANEAWGCLDQDCSLSRKE